MTQTSGSGASLEQDLLAVSKLTASFVAAVELRPGMIGLLVVVERLLQAQGVLAFALYGRVLLEF